MVRPCCTVHAVRHIRVQQVSACVQIQNNSRNSRLKGFSKKAILKKIAKLTGKHLCRSSVLI